ncbi:MAG TPA: ABC transporter permease [Motilibacterales bacterium]|nr:ABC transporter permease [Motilibacterales bacterium]
MSAQPIAADHAPQPALPPERRPTWPRWRPALRLALRDARGSRGRSALVVALVALPVALVVGLYLLGTSRAWADLQQPRQALGAVAAGSAEPATPMPSAVWSDDLPEGWRLVPWPALDATVGDPTRGLVATGTGGDFNDPVVRGLADLRTGRLPASIDQVLVTPSLARSSDLEVGDTWTVEMWNWAGSAPNPRVTLEVVGIAQMAGRMDGEAFIVGGTPPGWADRPGEGDRFLIASTTPITAEQVAGGAQGGVRIVGRDLAIENPEQLSLTVSDELVVGLAVAFLQIVMLAGAAFAVSLRRRQRELALLSAAGAEPGDLTRAVLASGILLGGIGAVLGFVLPWMGLVAGRPALERLFAVPLAPIPPMELAIVLVPIVGLFAALAASVVPARMAARIPLATALRARDSAAVRLRPGTDRPPVRSALAGVALIVAGALFLVWYPVGPDRELGAGGLPVWALGLAVLVCELGVVLLSPLALALVAARAPWLPLSARLAARDAARNRLRSSFAVAAVAVAVGLLAGCLTWLSSVQSAVKDAYIPQAAPGVVVLARSTDAARWGALGPEEQAAVAAEFPDAQVALIGIGPTWDIRSDDSLAVRSQCDVLAGLGVSGEALAVMAPTSRGALVRALPAGDPCRAPVPAGSPVASWHVIGDPSSMRPGVIVADADAAVLLMGRDDAAVRAQLESGGAVALDPSGVVDGNVRIAADPRGINGGDAGPLEFVAGPEVDVPAIIVDSAYSPAAVIVAPEALEARGMPVPRNAILVVPPTSIPDLVPVTDQLLTAAGLTVMSVESGPPASSLGNLRSGQPMTLGTGGLGWALVVGPLAFALLATVLVTALALGDARPELATMAAVGASPRVRRRFAMWAAIVVAGVGASLGAMVGIAPAWAALRSVDLLADPAACLWSPTSSGPDDITRELGAVYCDVPLAIPLDVPWAWLAAVVVGLPLVAGLVFLMGTRPRVVLPRR